MRAITVRQPYAWAITLGSKDVENRSRNIAGSYRGPIAIHAALKADEEALRSLPGLPPNGIPRIFDYGAIIGVADLVDVHDAEDCWTADMRRVRDLYANDREAYDALPTTAAGGLIGKTRMCSPWSLPSSQHLVLVNPRPLPTPIPCRGRLGLWTVPDDIAAQIEVAASPKAVKAGDAK